MKEEKKKRTWIKWVMVSTAIFMATCFLIGVGIGEIEKECQEAEEKIGIKMVYWNGSCFPAGTQPSLDTLNAELKEVEKQQAIIDKEFQKHV
jgi:hypothetical protein